MCGHVFHSECITKFAVIRATSKSEACPFKCQVQEASLPDDIVMSASPVIVNSGSSMPGGTRDAWPAARSPSPIGSRHDDEDSEAAIVNTDQQGQSFQSALDAAMEEAMRDAAAAGDVD